MLWNKQSSVEIMADKATVVSTGMEEVTVTLMGVDLGDVLANFDIKDVIEHYGLDSVMETVKELHDEE